MSHFTFIVPLAYRGGGLGLRPPLLKGQGVSRLIEDRESLYLKKVKIFLFLGKLSTDIPDYFYEAPEKDSSSPF